MRKTFKISSSITSASDYSFNWEYNKNIFQLWSMMRGWGYEEDIVTCHAFHMPCGPDSWAVASLGYFKCSSSTFVLLFCPRLLNIRVVFIPKFLYPFFLHSFIVKQICKALELLAQEESDDDDIIDEKVFNLTDDEGVPWIFLMLIISWTPSHRWYLGSGLGLPGEPHMWSMCLCVL